MAVGIGGDRQVEAEELVLRVGGDDAGIAHAVELDAPLLSAGLHECRDGAFDRVTGGRVAVLQQRADGVVDDLDDDVAFTRRRVGQRLDRERLAEFGSAIGLAFQLADDLLDLTSNSTAMGKATGKDASRGKGTLVALHGEAWARKQLGGLVQQAEELLEPYGEAANVLKAAARFVAERGR